MTSPGKPPRAAAIASALTSGAITVQRPPCRPRARAAGRPATVRSRIRSRSSSTITPTARGADAVACIHTAIDTARRLLDLADLRDDHGLMDILGPDGELPDHAPAPIAIVSDNGPCYRSAIFAELFTGDDPLLRHVRTRGRSPQTNGVVERFFATLAYEHLFRGPIADGDALAVEAALFRYTYNDIRLHQALGDRTPRTAYLAETASLPGSRRMTPALEEPRSGRSRHVRGRRVLAIVSGAGSVRRRHHVPSLLDAMRSLASASLSAALRRSSSSSYAEEQCAVTKVLPGSAADEVQRVRYPRPAPTV